MRSARVCYTHVGTQSICALNALNKVTDTMLKDHLREALASSELYDWLRQEIETGKRPIVRVVGHADSKSELNRLEKECINSYVSEGIPLYNKVWNSKATKAGQLIDILEITKEISGE